MKGIKRILSVALGCLLVFSMIGCSGNGKTEESDNPLKENRIKLMQFDYGDVALRDGLFKETYDRAKEYYLGISVDDMLYGMRSSLGMDTKSGKDLGGFGTGSNVLGQWISGNARYCAALGTQELQARVEELCDGIDEITKISPFFNDGKMMYSFEKYLRGVLDLYELCGLEKAFDIAKRMVDAAMNDRVYTEAVKALGDNGTASNILELEWYTMAEVLYAFADAAKEKGCTVTEVRAYTDFAKSFDYTEFWNIFYNEENLFDYSPVTGQNTSYFHAYSHLNSFNSAAGAYATTGSTYYLDSILKFYDFMREEQEMATGGYGAHVEWLMPEQEIVDALLQYHDNYENQCDTYAVYRLGNRLAAFTGEAKYGNWSEKLLYNSTIASLETHDGYAIYYSDYCADGGQKALRSDWRWACCAGSRPLNVNEVLSTIYYHDTQNIYVNLFVNSTVTMPTEGGDVVLTMQTDFPESEKVDVEIEASNGETFSVKFRKPEWLKGDVDVKVNGEAVEIREDEYGWLTVRRAWDVGDTIELNLPMGLTVSKAEYEADYGKEGVFAINYGPVTLAASMPNPLDDPADVLDGNSDIRAQLTNTETPLVFTAADDPNLVVKPYYAYQEGELYFLYMKLY